MFGVIEGAKGGEQPTHTPIEASDTLRSVSYAKIADLLGEGEIYGFALGFDRAVECIYLNKTPIGNADGSLNYQSVSVDSRSGTQAQTSIPGFSSVDNEVGVGLELKDTIPYTYTTTNLQLSALSVRISLPQGLQKANTNGDITGYSVQYAIDVKVDSGAFVTVLNGAFTGKASIAYERTHRVELPVGATTGWSLRVRRITVNANSASIADVTNIVSVTESIDVKMRYPNSAYVFLQLDAAQFPSIPGRAYHVKGRIVKVPANYDPDTRVYSGVWDGTFKLAYTNNPAWVYYDLVLHYRYGLGHLITSAQVDKWSLYPIAQYCDALVPDGKGGMEPRFTCNTYIQTQQQAYSLLQSMATTFRGISFYAGGMVSAVADMPSDPVYTYTHANVVNGVFTYNGSAGKTRYTVALVSWNDPNDFYKQKVQYYQDPDGYRRYGFKPTSMAAFGCTSQAMAARVGKWLTVSSRLEGEGVTFQVGLDGIFALPGQIVRISDRARTLVRMAGRVQTVGSTNSVVKPDVMPTVGVGDSLTVTLPTGVTETRTVSDVSETTITVSPAFSSAPSSQGIWLVENSELTAPMWKITGITEDTSSNGKTFNITAVRHYPGKYDFIDLGVPIDTPPIAGLPSNVMLGPDSVVITSNEVIGAVTAQSILTIHWTKVATATHYNVAWRKDNGDWLNLPVQYGVSVDISSNSPGTYVAAVWAVNGGGTSSRPVTSLPYQVGDITTLPTKIAAIDDKTTSIQTDLTVVQTQADQLRVDVDQAAANIQQEVTDRTDAINAEANARATAILNEQNTRSAAITSEATTRQTADDSLATQMSLVSAGSGEQFDSAKIWYFDVDLESWTGNGAPTIVDGWLRPANHATDPFVTSPTGIAIAGQSYRFAKMRIKKVGNPAWSGQLRWRLVGDAAGAWRGPAILPLPSFDGNGVTAIAWEDIAWWPGTIDQVRMDLSTVQDASNYYLIDWIALGRPTPGAGVALVQDETTARVAADSAEATQRSTLATQMRGAYIGTDVAALTSGLLFSERTARVTADSAMASDISSLQASVGTNTAAITSEQTARANADSALSTRIDSVTATANAAATQASLSAEQTARANADGAMAADISLLGAHNAGKTAFILDQNKVQIGGGQTFAQMLTGLQAADTTVNARVDNEQTARIDGDSANATAITSVQSQQSQAPGNLIRTSQFTATSGIGTWSGGVVVSSGAAQAPTGYALGVLIEIHDSAPRGTSSQGYFPVTAADVYDMSIDSYVSNMNAGALLLFGMLFRMSDGSFVYQTPIQRASPGGWATSVGKIVVPSGAVEGRGYLRTTSTTGRAIVNSMTIARVGATAVESASVTQALIANVGPSGAYAQATTMLDVNGRITGVSQTNNGTTGDFKILADKFSIESPAGGARTEYSTGNWRVYDSAGVLRVRMGIW